MKTRVSVSGAAGRMGTLVAGALADADDLELGALYAPGHAGELVAGREVTDDSAQVASSEIVVEFTTPSVVEENLRRWRELAVHCVVGTSGFDEARLDRVRSWWGSGPPNCLVVPNFSIGAVLMMAFAEEAAAHFGSAEIVELHHGEKADAPSGTALATADRMRRLSGTGGPPATDEIVSGARGADVSGVRIHSVRLPGLVAHQEVLLGAPGEVLTIRHDITDRRSLLAGVLLAVRGVGDLPGVTVGMESLL